MQTTTVDETIVDKLHAHIQAGGEGAMKKSVLSKIVGGPENLDAYTKRMVEKYPEQYAKDDEPEAIPTTDKPEDYGQGFSGPARIFQLLNDKNQLQSLSLVSTSKSGKVILKLEEPEDKVTIFYRGAPVVVDLYQVRKTNQSPLEGLSVSSVLVMGEAARPV